MNLHVAGVEEGDDGDDVDDDDAFADEDILDLTTAVPPAPEPIVPVKKSTAQNGSAPKSKRPYNGRFAAKCAHSGSDISSGSTGSDELDDDDQKQFSSFVDDSPIMTRKDKKRVRQFMEKYVILRGKKKRRR